MSVRLPFATKLVVGFLLVAVPSVIVVGGIGFYSVGQLTLLNRQLEEISRSLEATRDLQTAVAQTMLPPSEFLIHGTAGEDERFETLMNEVEAQLNSCANAACHGASRQPKEMAASLFPHFRAIKEPASIIFRPGETFTPEDKFHLLHEINHQAEEVYQQLERMSSALLLRVDSLQEKSREVSRQARKTTLAFTLLVVGLAILTAYLISRRLLRPVRELLLGTRHVREGDLKYRVAVRSGDETGELAQSFNAMTEELQKHRERLQEMVQTKTDELRRTQDSLLQSEKLASIGLLASGVAHELNNPLTSILMNINLLMEEVGDKPEVHKELRRISDDTLRCKRIIDDLRDFSRRHELDVRPTDLNGVVISTIELIKHQLALHEVALRQDFSSDIPLVPCDTDRIRQVLMNVFVNAIQAMPRGGTLTVTTGMRAGLAEIAVVDTGPGIPRPIRSKIFDPFFTTKEAGTGLGLSIVYRIMEEHGGRVEVESLTEEEIRAGASESTGTAIRLLIPTIALSKQQSTAG